MVQWFSDSTHLLIQLNDSNAYRKFDIFPMKSRISFSMRWMRQRKVRYIWIYIFNFGLFFFLFRKGFEQKFNLTVLALKITQIIMNCEQNCAWEIILKILAHHYHLSFRFDSNWNWNNYHFCVPITRTMRIRMLAISRKSFRTSFVHSITKSIRLREKKKYDAIVRNLMTESNIAFPIPFNFFTFALRWSSLGSLHIIYLFFSSSSCIFISFLSSFIYVVRVCHWFLSWLRFFVHIIKFIYTMSYA